ncbi:MAG TPA: TonB-dependent hemoglobin/transferrin/lactoferrin family receptor [Tardiphaga sp.]
MMSLVATVPASAQDTAPAVAAANATYRFDIPAKSLAAAIADVGARSGWRILYTIALPAGAQSRPLSGSYTVAQALAQILAGTGISYRVTGARAAMLLDPTQSRAAAGDGIALDPIDVEAANRGANGYGFQGAPDWVYHTPASVSVVSREAIKNSPPRNTSDLLRGVAGVTATSDTAQNQGVNVNIRGLQDQNRINMMIDGARQNFQRAGHGSTGLTYVDPAMIREVDVEKSTTSGVGGAGSLGGAVNFRTIVADDLMKLGEKFGAELDLTAGTNEYNFAGAASAAGRISESFSVLGAISHKEVGEYAIGQNGKLTGDWAVLGLERPVFTGSNTWSGMLKTEMNPTDTTTLNLSWLRYQSEFSQGVEDDGREDRQNVTNDTYNITFGWKPDSNLIDFKSRLWYNRVDNHEFRPQRTADVAEVNAEYKLGTLGGSLENTSRFAVPAGVLALNYGAEAFRDNGKTTATGSGIEATPEKALWYSGANPGGVRDVASGFANATLQHDDWLTLSGGLRYDTYKLTGTSVIFLKSYYEQVVTKVLRPGVCRPIPTAILNNPNPAVYAAYVARITAAGQTISGTNYCTAAYYENETTEVLRTPTERVDVDLSGAALLPTAMIAVTPTHGLQLFGKYSQSLRPPTLMEALLGGSHIGSLGAGQAPNPMLKPEEATTYEIGANLSYDGIFQAGDRLRGKIVAFHRQVDNYVALGAIDLVAGGTATKYTAYVNLDGKTPMNGVELEANYDTGRYYVGGSFSYISTDYATTYSYGGASYTTGAYVLFVPPKTKAALDAGIRLFDEKLTLGARVTYSGGVDQEIGILSSLVSSGYSTSEYKVYDIYGSYAVNAHAKLRFAVNNLTDLAYVPALGAASLPAPGRTATVSLNLKF